jgi:hypothetical protein
MGWLAFAFVLGLIFISIACALYYQAVSVRAWRAQGPLQEPVPAKESAFPPPRLQSKPALDLAHFRQKEDEILNGYRWIDRDAGIVQIPIDQAIALEAQRGEPVRQGPPGPTWAEMMQSRAQQGVSEAPGRGAPVQIPSSNLNPSSVSPSGQMMPGPTPGPNPQSP